MTADKRLTAALQDAQPGHALRSLVLELSAEGRSKAEIYKLLENFLTRLRSRGDRPQPEEKEVVLDVMDALTGWCHPGAQLLPGEPAV